jgi:predicted nucleic acid-binding protein
MIVVLDASAAVGIVIGTTSVDTFGSIIANADLVIAPDLFTAEVCNAFWKYGKAGQLTTDACKNGVGRALALTDRLESSHTLHGEAFALALRYSHPVYDTLYLVLARRNSATLLTMDRRLAELARNLELDVISVA